MFRSPPPSRRRYIAFLLGAATLMIGARAAAPVRLTTLEWPPYTSAAARQQGIATAIVRAALAAEGLDLNVTFYPWRRAVAMARAGQGADGYFPEYFAPQVAADFYLSEPFGSGPLGFVENVHAPVPWQRLEDLAPYRVGVVLGYVNAEAFDRRIAAGLQPVDYARDDAQNLLKLAAGRIALAVIDRRVFDHLVRTDPQVHAVAASLRFQPHLLDDKQFYVCFRRTEAGRMLRDRFNAGLRRIDAAAITRQVLDAP